MNAAAAKTANKAQPAQPAEPLNIEPGRMVQVKIVREPSSERAVKTLKRVLAKDPTTRPQQRERKLSRTRAMTTKRRGGRDWEHRPKKVSLFQGEVGEQSTILATVDVLKDLNSVRRFIEVTPAK